MPSISAKIRALLNLTGRKQIDLREPLGMASPQSLSKKFTKEQWDASDLVTIAAVTGCRVGFILPNGDTLLFDDG